MCQSVRPCLTIVMPLATDMLVIPGAVSHGCSPGPAFSGGARLLIDTFTGPGFLGSGLCSMQRFHELHRERVCCHSTMRSNTRHKALYREPLRSRQESSGCTRPPAGKLRRLRCWRRHSLPDRGLWHFLAGHRRHCSMPCRMHGFLFFTKARGLPGCGENYGAIPCLNCPALLCFVSQDALNV